MRWGSGHKRVAVARGETVQTRLRCLCAVALLLATAGCSGVHLHDEDRAETAEAAAAAYEEIDIDGLFAAARANQARLLAGELEAVRGRATADREANLAIVAVSEEPLRAVWYERQFLVRLQEIGLGTTDDAGAMEDRLRRVVQLSGDLEEGWRKLQQLEIQWAELPGNETELTRCGPEQDVTSNDPDTQTATDPDSQNEAWNDTAWLFQDVRAALVNACESWQKAHADLRGLFSGVGEVTAALQAKLEAQREIADAKAAVADVKQALSNARSAIGDAQVNEPDKAPSEILAPLQERLTDAVGEGTEFVKSQARLALFEDAVQQLDRILKAAAGDTQANDKLDLFDRSAAYTLAALPELADRLSALARSTQRVPSTALIMVKLDLEARLRTLKAEVARQRARRDLQMARYEALIEEIREYNVWVLPALNVLRADSPATLAQPLSATEADSRARRVAVAMVGEFAVIRSRAMNESYAAEYRLIAQDYTLALARERALIAQWEAVAGPLVAQQRRYHAGGIEPVDLASLAILLVQTAGIFSIADGVN